MADPRDLARRARALLRAGQAGPAIAAYRELVRHRPRDADAWYNLGYLLRCERRFADALDAYGRALAAGIDRPEEVRLNRAAILSEYLHRDAEAAVELRAATEAAPGFTPAWHNLGNLHEDAGDADAARDAYARALALDPLDGRALARTAALDVSEGRAGQAVDGLRAALARVGGEPARAAEIGFALAGALDAAGEHDEAFARVEAANALARSLLPPALRYDRTAHEAYADALTRLPPAPGADRPDRRAPILVLGMFRSGSTLTERLLSRHPRVTAGGELEILPAAARAMPGYPAPPSPGDAERLRAAYLAETDALYPARDRLTDKRPDNFLHLGLARRAFPGAPAVHTVRDPLDVAVSVFFLHFGDGVPWGQDLSDFAHWYGQYRRIMDHWRALGDGVLHDVPYERLVREPEQVMRPLVAALGLEWDPAVLAPEAAAGPVRTASAWQVRQPLHARSVGRWRAYERQLAPLADALDRLGLLTA